MRLRHIVLVLVALACAGSIIGSAVVAAPPDYSTLLQRLRTSKTPQKDGEVAAKTSTDQASALALDLIIYDWICGEFQISPEISNLANMVQGLATASNPAVEWARASLATPEGKYGKPTYAPQRGEVIDKLRDARAAILKAVPKLDSSPATAVNSLNAAFETLDSLGLGLSSAAVLWERGNQYLGMGQYRLAEADFEQSLWIFSSYKSDSKAAEVLESLGTLNMQLARYSEAHRRFHSAAHKWLSLGDGRKACRDFVQACRALSAMGRQEDAQITMMVGYREGMNWASANKSYDWFAEDLLDMGNIAIEWKAWADARDLLIDADKWAKLSGDARLRADVLGKLAPVWIEAAKQASPENYAAGQAKAAECLCTREQVLKTAVAPGTEALVIISKGTPIPVADRGKLAADLMTAAWALEQLGQFRQATTMYEQSGLLSDKLGRKSDRAMALWGAAKAYEKAGNTGSAIDVRKKAVATAMSAGMKSTAAQILLELGSLYSVSNPQIALKTLQEAALAAQESGVWREYVQIQRYRAKLLVARKEYLEAERHLSAAGQMYIAFVGEPWLFAETSLDLAELYKATDNLDKEKDTLTDAAGRIESWAEYESINPANTEPHTELLKRLYARLIPLEIASEPDKAAGRLRRADRQGWLSTLSEAIESSGNTLAMEMLAKFNEAQKELLPLDITGRVVAEGWPAVLRSAWQLGESNPFMSRSVTVDITEVYKNRLNMPDDLAIVEYLLGENTIHAFVLGRNQAFCRQISIERAQMESYLRALRNSLVESEERMNSGIPVPPVESWDMSVIAGGSQDRDIRDLRRVTEALIGLGSILIVPIRTELDFAKTIAFIPPPDLMGVPFHSFAWVNEGSVKFLIEDFAVCYATPMMFGDLVGPPKAIKKNSGKLLVFANPLQDLNGAAAEAVAIGEAYPENEVFVGQQATRDQFKKQAASAAILHIAAHYKPDSNPGRFSLDLAPGTSGIGTIGIDDLYEIMNPGLALVVLSACETAGSTNPMLASTARAAEILSLTGAPTVIGTLWKVSDKGTVKLMSEMYRDLWEGTTKAEAVRRAQIAMIKSGKRELAHPVLLGGLRPFR